MATRSVRRSTSATALLPCPPKKARVDERVSRIRVVVRKRPLTKREEESSKVDIIECREEAAADGHPASAAVLVHEPKVKVDMTQYMEGGAVTRQHSQKRKLLGGGEGAAAAAAAAA